MNDGGIRSDGCAIVQRDGADHDRSCSDTHAIAKGRLTLRVVSDGDLLIDPAVATHGFGCDDRADSVLDEQAWADPFRVDCECGCRPIEPAKQQSKWRRCPAKTVVDKRSELGQRSDQVSEARVLVEC